MRLAVERRMGRATGSLGYHPGGSEPLDKHEINSAAGTQYGQSDSSVGAAVNVPF